MPGETIRSVQCHQKVGCLFRKQIWSTLRKVHSVESEKGKEEWNENLEFMFLNFCYSMCGGIKRFSSLFGNHFSRFCACMSVCNGKPVLVRGDSAQESCLGFVRQTHRGVQRAGWLTGSHARRSASPPPASCHLGKPCHFPIEDENQKGRNYLGHREGKWMSHNPDLNVALWPVSALSEILWVERRLACTLGKLALNCYCSCTKSPSIDLVLDPFPSPSLSVPYQ